jgi:hypothetical protein
VLLASFVLKAVLNRLKTYQGEPHFMEITARIWGNILLINELCQRDKHFAVPVYLNRRLGCGVGFATSDIKAAS